MQAFSLSLIKGRLGSDQERREIQTSPQRKRARGRSSARPEGPGRRTPPPRRSVACVPGPDLSHPNRCAQGAVHAGDNAVFAVGNARRASTGRRCGSN